MKRTCTIAAALAGTLTAAAIADIPANVRVIHASPDAPNVDVFANGGLAFSNLAFGQATDYAALPGGDYNFQVTPFGQMNPVVIDADASLMGGTDYSIVAVDTLANIAPLVLVDDNTLDPDQARVRFVHASPDAPAVDIAVAGGGPVLFSDISFTNVGDYLSLDAGTYDLEVRVAGTDNVVLDLAGITLDAGTVYSVFAMGFAGGMEPGLQAVIFQDAVIPAPAALSLLAVAGLFGTRRRRVS